MDSILTLTETVTSKAKAWGADIVGIGGIDRFRDIPEVLEIYPDTKSVICLAFRVLHGSHRGIEESSTYYQYSTTGVETIEETVMPGVLLRLSALIEDAGFIAVPQRRNQLVMTETDSTNPEMLYDDIYRGVKTELSLPFEKVAVLCGVGEMGLHGTVLTDAFGPYQRLCCILTDAELIETPLAAPHLCDGCMECVKACPGRAINDKGEKNAWQCAAYYNGANKANNPFMPDDAYENIPDRELVMRGEKQLTREEAIAVIDATLWYPPIKQGYTASICGKACDVACHKHLLAKGKIKR